MTSHGSIEPDKDQIREEPYSLPTGFSWDALDLGNAAVVRNPEKNEFPPNLCYTSAQHHLSDLK